MSEVKIYTVVSDELSPPVIGESFCTDMVRHSDYAALEQKLTGMAVHLANAESKYWVLAAENAGLKDGVNKAIEDIQCFYDSYGWHVSEDGESETAVVALDDAKGSIEHFALSVKTPATDAFLAEVRESARNEGINYAASRLAAAFNHGFLDKPVAEVLDVTRMILSAKEDLANDSLPASDGLSGEYAEKAIEEWSAQLSQEATQ
ncbi:hypothetical protein ACR2RY_001709 [Salmonella enterica]